MSVPGQAPSITPTRLSLRNWRATWLSAFQGVFLDEILGSGSTWETYSLLYSAVS